MGKARGKGRKIGRMVDKAKRYKGNKTREKNKLKRVLQSQGHSAAVEYAKKNGLSSPKQPTIKENTKGTGK